MENEKNMKNGIFFGIIGVATLVVAVIGATYAYFTATNTNSGTIAGTAANAGIDLSVTLTSTAATGVMVPQKGSAISNAITGTGNSSCVDGNGNTVCKVYTITVKNTGTSTALLTGTINLTSSGTGSTMTNLKWAVNQTGAAGTNFTSATKNAYTVTSLASNVSLAKNATKTYYLVVWIEETGASQNNTDKGSFTGSITFNSGTAGVTSTITS